jgi:beta-lactamase class A
MPTPALHPSFQPLADAIQGSIASSGGPQVGVSLTELGGPSPKGWSLSPDHQFIAGSTYKLPLLMLDTQMVSSGRASLNDSICYQDGDWEDGWFSDYYDGACFSRGELEQRIGTYSDNTAAHMLVRVDGGSGVLNSFAASLGASESAFYDPNTTTASDLGHLWQAEAAGGAGGVPQQALLYPLLTNTHYESGIPAGIPPGASQVVHKVGFIDNVDNDAALVLKGPNGPYVLVVCTDGLGGDPGWALIAQISRLVWNYEAGR